MIVCPVCEHAQAAGAECDVCGKKLLHGPAAVPAVAAVEGLEPTLHAPAARAPDGERIAELEPTLHRAAPAPPPDATPGIEATRAAPVEVTASLIPDLERTAAAGLPGDAPTEVPLFVTCRYCRTPAMPGEHVCARCGMRLPTYGPAIREAAEERRLCSCGAPVAGVQCPSCGARRHDG